MPLGFFAQYSQVLFVFIKTEGKISAQPQTIVKQICFLNGNLLFLSLFSLNRTECIM